MTWTSAPSRWSAVLLDDNPYCVLDDARRGTARTAGKSWTVSFTATEPVELAI